MFSKERLVFDPAAASETDNIGAYLRSSDGTLLTHTTVGGKEALDVNVVNEVDIRDLSSATDSVSAVQSGAWTVDVGNTVTVQATDLDIRNLAFATDTVDVSGSAVSITGNVNVTQGTSPWVVSATDLDVRDLSHTQDNIAIAQGGNTLVVNADGSINVNADIDIVNGAEKAEDGAHVSGDIGQFVLAVRQDTLASSTSADGDYAAFKVNQQGALYVEVVNQSASVPSFNGLLVSQNTVDTTAELVVAADLSDRKRILVQNVSSNRTVYLGHANTVTASNGLRLSSGAAIELDLTEGVALYAISNAAGADLRIAELAAV
jgi:hypothetical protein